MKTLIVFRISFKLLLLQVFARNVLLVQHYTAIHCTIDNNTLQITTLNSVHHCTVAPQNRVCHWLVLCCTTLLFLQCTVPHPPCTTLYYAVIQCTILIFYTTESATTFQYTILFSVSQSDHLCILSNTL